MTEYPAHPAATNPARPWCLGDDTYRVDITLRDRWECPSHLVGCIPHSVAHVPAARRYQAVAVMTWPNHLHRHEDNRTWIDHAGVRMRWVYGETMEEARWRMVQRREREGWAHYPPTEGGRS